MNIKKRYEKEIEGQNIKVEFSDLTEQANGSVILSCGNTKVLATVVMAEEEKENLSFFPLTVNYEEKFYATGQILGSRFTRREGKPSEEATLSARAIDRTIRPLFEKNIRREVQVVITVLSIEEYDPDVLAINAASLALATSDIPWSGPVSAIRINKRSIEENFKINPTYSERGGEEDAKLDVLACGKDGKINMIEAKALETEEKEVFGALKTAEGEIEKLQNFQEEIIKDIGNHKKIIKSKEMSEEFKNLFTTEIEPNLYNAIFSKEKNASKVLKNEWMKKAKAELEEEEVKKAGNYFEKKVDEIVHKGVLEEEKRSDGRSIEEIRPLKANAGGVSEILHGAGIFYRGGTHLFSTLTLGGPGESLVIDAMEVQEKKRFMHHYNFPPFSTGETGFMGSPSRRAIGHGSLAEKSLSAVIPSKQDFPYTIRLVSECMASNGSTSMASVCASSLSLMDGGVPIKRPVAGIAMGLMYKNEKNYKILTDIQGAEDHHGDMDLKVAGTKEGITAIQMDVKVEGVPLSILEEAFEKAKKARVEILSVIESEIAKPRDSISKNAPEIKVTQINPEKIAEVIGPGGKVINGIKDETEVEDISIEDDGSIFITGKYGTAENALNKIESIVKEYEVGEVVKGVVSRITDFGAFVKIGSKEGLVHISEIAPFRIEKTSDVLSEDEEVKVKVKEIDDKGRIALSIKDINPDFAKKKGISPK